VPSHRVANIAWKTAVICLGLLGIALACAAVALVQWMAIEP
jgi:hypothetical protein